MIFKHKQKHDFMIDHHSYAHNLSSCEVKAWKKIQTWTGSHIWSLIYLFALQMETVVT